MGEVHTFYTSAIQIALIITLFSITHVLITAGNPEVRHVVDSVVSEALTTLFEWQPALCNAVITKALQAQQASVAAKAAREMVSRFTFFV